MQSILGFLKYYSVDLVSNLLNDERRAVSLIVLSDESLSSDEPDVCSLRLVQCIRQAEADVALFLSNPDLDALSVQNMVTDLSMEYVYKRKGVLDVPSSIKDACDKHRETLLLINQQKLDTFSLSQDLNAPMSIVATDEGVFFDYD